MWDNNEFSLQDNIVVYALEVPAFGAEPGSLVNSNSVSPTKEVEIWAKNRTVSENTDKMLKVPYTHW